MFALAAGLSMPAASAQSMTDADFIVKAAEAGAKEVDVAKLAVEKASNPDVKGFARTLMIDHSIANEELLKLSKSKNVAVTVNLRNDPTESPKPGQPEAAADAAFDRGFIEQMVKDHQEALELFKAEADDGKDSEVKEWAERKLLTLKQHLRLAKDLQDKIARLAGSSQ
jgi:putative membrane protein